MSALRHSIGSVVRAVRRRIVPICLCFWPFKLIEERERKGPFVLLLFVAKLLVEKSQTGPKKDTGRSKSNDVK